MKPFNGKAFLLGSLMVLATVVVSAQGARLIKDQSSVTVSGTSSVHDWHETAGDFTATLKFQANDGPVSVIEKVTFVCKSASLTSDNSIMTNKTQDALQAKKYPEITFISGEPISVSGQDGAFSAVVNGELSLNGIRKKLLIPVKGTYTGDKLSVSGSQSLKMSDYNIKPPTAMLGTLKTGNEITVHFDLKFQISDNH